MLLSRFWAWLAMNTDSVFLGIVVSSLLVLALQGAVRVLSSLAVSLVTVRWRLRLFWGVGVERLVYVVSGDIGRHDGLPATLCGLDAEAATAVAASLRLIYPDTRVQHRYSTSFPRESYKETLIAVGGPVNNQCTALMLEHFRDTVWFQGHDLCVPGASFSAHVDGQGYVITDYGAVIKGPNPYDPSHDVLLVLGCHTHGVLAAAVLLSERSESRQARKAAGKALGIMKYLGRRSWFAVVSCPVLGNDIGEVGLEKCGYIIGRPGFSSGMSSPTAPGGGLRDNAVPPSRPDAIRDVESS